MSCIWHQYHPDLVGLSLVQANARLRAIRYLLIQFVNFDEIVDAWLVDKERGDDRKADGADEIAPDLIGKPRIWLHVTNF